MTSLLRPVIHVTESFGGGVAAAIRDYCRNYPGAEHHLIYAPRQDAPIETSDTKDFASVTELRPGHMRRVTDLRRYLREHPESVIHAHSSFAGAYVRAAVIKRGQRPIIYTPHCYGFERRDSSNFRRGLYWALEWFFSFNTTAFAACSKREAELSNWPMASARRVHLPNVAASDIEAREIGQFPGRVAKVVGAGRLGPQKDPLFFRDCIVALRQAGNDVEAAWIGGGDTDTELVLAAAGIATTGWLSRASVLEELRGADVYVHSAKWEGFPIAVLEASLIGVPIIARDIAAFSGVDMPLLISSPDELVERWPSLESAAVRRSMVQLASEALSGCNDEAQATALRKLYSSELARR